MADRREFLLTGLYPRQDMDDEVRVTQLLASGGPRVKEGAQRALDGSAEDRRDFLRTGQQVARARDQETQTVAALAEQAAQAGKRAETETAAAKEASARAVEASRLAKEAARRAAEETKAAKDSAGQASALKPPVCGPRPPNRTLPPSWWWATDARSPPGW